MNVVVLGAGLVGAPMAMDLAKNNEFNVTVIDINVSALEKLHPFGIRTNVQDLSNLTVVKEQIQSFDIVINAVPGFMGYQTLKAIIEAGKNVVDIAFFPEDPFNLNELAKEKNVIAIMDCGVAPGMSNILTGYAYHQLDKATTALTYVGGLPEVRKWPYEYKAVFSPIDVIEEYTRPARYVENGKMVVKPALTDPELLNFPKIGTLESFNSDGLRTLAQTLNIPNMKEKTLRYPGHIQIMEIMRETGLFSEEEMDIKGVKVRPIDVTSKLLFNEWELKDEDVDITVMQVIIEGEKDGKSVRYTYDLYDKRDKETGIHSMARTTGYTATMAVRLIAKGLYKDTGLSAPEYIGKYPECVSFMLEGLRERGVVYNETIEYL